jgi:hypothetical protein
VTRRRRVARIPCQAAVPGWSHRARACRYRARWWVGYRIPPLSAQAVCGTHARAWSRRWPQVSEDPVADLALAQEGLGVL